MCTVPYAKSSQRYSHCIAPFVASQYSQVWAQTLVKAWVGTLLGVCGMSTFFLKGLGTKEVQGSLTNLYVFVQFVTEQYSQTCWNVQQHVCQ